VMMVMMMMMKNEDMKILMLYVDIINSFCVYFVIRVTWKSSFLPDHLQLNKKSENNKGKEKIKIATPSKISFI